VLTSVARDDLPDQGAGWFVQTMAAIREVRPQADIEVLTPDFRGNVACIQTIVEAQPVCYNHNIETVERLSRTVRRGATYRSTLKLLQTVKALNPQLPTKSGIMLGHSETVPEILATLQDLRTVGCDRVTIGQYLQPSQEHLPVQKYWAPEEFAELGEQARQMGFSDVRSGPLVRSSYHAGQMGAVPL
jgi:lipoyl synthase